MTFFYFLCIFFVHKSFHIPGHEFADERADSVSNYLTRRNVQVKLDYQFVELTKGRTGYFLCQVGNFFSFRTVRASRSRGRQGSPSQTKPKKVSDSQAGNTTTDEGRLLTVPITLHIFLNLNENTLSPFFLTVQQ